MSTKSNPVPGAAATLFLCAWLVACAAAWDRSTTSGGPDSRQAAAAVAAGVAAGTRMSTACRSLAGDLAEAAIRAKVAALRPTARVLAQAEDRAYAAWVAAGCPARALPGIAFGVAEAVNRQAWGRMAGRSR